LDRPGDAAEPMNPRADRAVRLAEGQIRVLRLPPEKAAMLTGRRAIG